MTEAKHKRLMTAARRVPPIEAPPGFGDDVLRTIRNGEPVGSPSGSSVADQLTALFPRLAAAALVFIVVAAAFEFFTGGNVTSQLTEVSDQWLLPLDWI